MAPKADILNDTLGEFPAMIVVTKADILDEMSGDFPAVFVAKTVVILKQKKKKIFFLSLTKTLSIAL